MALPVFKTEVPEDLGQVGSIPIRLRRPPTGPAARRRSPRPCALPRFRSSGRPRLLARWFLLARPASLDAGAQRCRVGERDGRSSRSPDGPVRCPRTGPSGRPRRAPVCRRAGRRGSAAPTAPSPGGHVDDLRPGERPARRAGRTAAAAHMTRRRKGPLPAVRTTGHPHATGTGSRVLRRTPARERLRRRQSGRAPAPGGVACSGPLPSAPARRRRTTAAAAVLAAKAAAITQGRLRRWPSA